MKGQKEYVVEAVRKVLGATWTPGSIDVRATMSKSEYRTVINDVTNAILAGQVKYSGEKNHYTVNRYVTGMVANHMKKAKELICTSGAAASEAQIDFDILPEELRQALAPYV